MRLFGGTGRLCHWNGWLRWSVPTDAATTRAKEIADLVRELFPNIALEGQEPLFAFIDKLKAPLASVSRAKSEVNVEALRMGYSYFALCGDPLLDPALDPYPDGLLARLSALGENAVWLPKTMLASPVFAKRKHDSR